MPRPIFFPTRPAHVTIGMLERRDARSAFRAQRVAGIKSLPAHKRPIETWTDAEFAKLQQEMDAELASTDYNIGG